MFINVLDRDIEPKFPTLADIFEDKFVNGRDSTNDELERFLNKYLVEADGTLSKDSKKFDQYLAKYKGGK